MSPVAASPQTPGPSAADKLVTVEEFEQMEFEFPVELVNGKVEQMPPPGGIHGVVCGNVYLMLSQWSRQTGLGVVSSNDSAVVTQRNPDTVRGCDVAYLTWESLPDEEVPPGAFRIAPRLAVEVLSPTDRWTEVLEKILEYLRSGVGEVWVVDPVQRTVEIHHPDQPPVHLTDADSLTRPELLPGFSCEVSEFFANLKRPR